MNNNPYIDGGNLEGKVYCNQCRAVTKPKLKGSGWITIILLLFYIIPGLIYMVWRRSGLGVCGNCNSSNVIWTTCSTSNCITRSCSTTNGGCGFLGSDGCDGLCSK